MRTAGPTLIWVITALTAILGVDTWAAAIMRNVALQTVIKLEQALSHDRRRQSNHGENYTVCTTHRFVSHRSGSSASNRSMQACATL